MAKLGDSHLNGRLRHFEHEFEDSDVADSLAWFPAWLLIDDAHLAARLKPAVGNGSPAEYCARLIMNLLALERGGRHHEVVEERRKLRDSHATLFARYMQTR
jgi:hypothetical protein